jgi:hypothetical protein
MPPRVAGADRNQRHAGTDPRDEWRGRRGVAAVVSDFEKAGLERQTAPQELRLDRPLDVTGQERGGVAIGQPEHEGIVVRPRRPGARTARGVQDLDRSAARADDDPASWPEDRGPGLVGRRLEPAHGRIRGRHRSEPDGSWTELAHDRHRAPDVIAMGVRDREQVDAQQSEGAQRRCDDASADVEVGSRQSSGVHEHREPVRQADQEGVTLADVERRDLQAPGRARAPSPGDHQDRHHQSQRRRGAPAPGASRARRRGEKPQQQDHDRPRGREHADESPGDRGTCRGRGAQQREQKRSQYDARAGQRRGEQLRGDDHDCEDETGGRGRHGDEVGQDSGGRQ